MSDAEWAPIEPLLPLGRKGAHRVDERRVTLVISGSCTCCTRERGGATALGPYTTVYNRLNRWSRQGIWHGLFEALTGHSGVHGGRGMVSIDATYIKAHRSAAGAKGGPSCRA